MSEHQANDDAAFEIAAQQLRDAAMRSELDVKEIPAPVGTSAQAVAFSAGIIHNQTPTDFHDGESPYGAGRLILVHDEKSREEWGGPFRVICFAQAPLEIEIATDPFIAQVAWTWLIEALELRNAEYSYPSGTATKTLSAGFGSLAHQGDAAQIEIRASWTPHGTDFSAHAEAWGELLCLLAGYPHHEGVASLGAKRAQRSNGRGA